MKFISSKLRLFLSVATIWLLGACSITDEILPVGPAPQAEDEKVEEDPPDEVEEEAALLSNDVGPRIVRRMSLDLNHKLPDVGIMEMTEDEDFDLEELVDGFLANGKTSLALSRWFQNIWGFDYNNLPDLDRYIDEGNIVLELTLTEKRRRQILDEVSSSIRYAVDNNTPYSQMFNQNFVIAENDLLSFWGLQKFGEPFIGESGVSFAQFEDGREQAGILSSAGFMANFSSYGTGEEELRNWDILQRLMCLPSDVDDSHLFYKVSTEELASNLSDIAKTSESCLSCHVHTKSIAGVFSGMHSASSYSNWKSYDKPDDTSGIYAGIAISGPMEFGAYIGKDPRTHRCMISRMYEELIQKQENDLDTETLFHAQSAFITQGHLIKSFLKTILLDQQYLSEIVSSKVRSKYRKKSSGLRFLNRNHWRGILDQLSPSASILEVPNELNLGGYDKRVERYYPNQWYWHATNRIARQAANAVVSDELADGISGVSRRVLTRVPDGAGSSVSSAGAMVQITDLWWRFAGVRVSEGSDQYTKLQGLWEAGLNGGSTDADYRRAWRLILVALFTDFDFIRY